MCVNKTLGAFAVYIKNRVLFINLKWGALKCEVEYGEFNNNNNNNMNTASVYCN